MKTEIETPAQELTGAALVPPLDPPKVPVKSPYVHGNVPYRIEDVCSSRNLSCPSDKELKKVK